MRPGLVRLASRGRERIRPERGVRVHARDAVPLRRLHRDRSRAVSASLGRGRDARHSCDDAGRGRLGRGRRIGLPRSAGARQARSLPLPELRLHALPGLSLVLDRVPRLPRRPQGRRLPEDRIGALLDLQRLLPEGQIRQRLLGIYIGQLDAGGVQRSNGVLRPADSSLYERPLRSSRVQAADLLERRPADAERALPGDSLGRVRRPRLGGLWGRQGNCLRLPVVPVPGDHPAAKLREEIRGRRRNAPLPRRPGGDDGRHAEDLGRRRPAPDPRRNLRLESSRDAPRSLRGSAHDLEGEFRDVGRGPLRVSGRPEPRDRREPSLPAASRRRERRPRDGRRLPGLPLSALRPRRGAGPVRRRRRRGALVHPPARRQRERSHRRHRVQLALPGHLRGQHGQPPRLFRHRAATGSVRTRALLHRRPGDRKHLPRPAGVRFRHRRLARRRVARGLPLPERRQPRRPRLPLRRGGLRLLELHRARPSSSEAASTRPPPPTSLFRPPASPSPSAASTSAPRRRRG